MYGWRAKIGLITPMTESAEHALHIYAPEGVSFASSKINPRAVCEEDLVSFKAQLGPIAEAYKDSDMDVVVLGCSAGSRISGLDWDKECVSLIESKSGIPGLTTGIAVLEALNALGCKKVAVMTPYPEAQNAGEKKFLEDNGFEVTNIVGMDMTAYTKKDGKPAYYDADDYFLYQNARKVDLNGAEVFYISGMCLATMEIIGDLETYLEIPVVTDHQATLWGALRHSRVGAKLSGVGKLFTL